MTQLKICFEDLSDTQWEIISKILNDPRKRKHNLRSVINGILSILRQGTQWRNLEKCYPIWQIVYYYFAKWGKGGTLERVNSELNKLERKRQGKKAMPSLLSLDSQLVKSVAFVNQDKGIDENKFINGPKRHSRCGRTLFRLLATNAKNLSRFRPPMRMPTKKKITMG